MASVTLTEYECRKNLLPNVCMRCGEPATTLVRRNFSWYPQWIILLVLVALLVAAIVAMILTKRMLVHVPMCEQHQGHWSKRMLWMLLTFGVLSLLAIGGIALLSAAENGPDKETLTGVVCGGGVFGLLAWLILVVVLQSGMIRPTEITDRQITLTKVHPEFVRALEDERAADEDDDDDRPKPRGPAKNLRDRDDDRPPPRKKKNDPWYDD